MGGTVVDEATAGTGRGEDAGGSSRPGERMVGEAIAAFQRGTDRESAFRRLYEIYFQAIQRFFRRKGYSAEDALDLTQETFLRVYRSLDGYEHRERFAGWLYRVATTTHLKDRRRAATAKRAAVEVSRDAMQAPDPSLTTAERQLDTLLDDERREALRQAIRKLPDQQRDCLVLRLYQQLAYREIAVVKKLAPQTVKAHLFRARKALEASLEGHPLRELEAIEDPAAAEGTR